MSPSLASSAVHLGLAPERATPVLATGIPDLDASLPGGGLPAGRLVELSGPSASGKLSLALVVSARLLARGEPVALLDPEGNAHPDPRREPALGALLVVRGGGLLTALRAADILLRCGAFALLVLDLPARHAQRPRPSALMRLAQAAGRTGTVLALLTERRPETASWLGPWVSLGLQVRRGPDPSGRSLEVALARNKLGVAAGPARIDLAAA